VHAAFLAEALTAAGWDVTLYALDKDGGGFFRDVRARLRLVPAGPAPATTAELVRQRAGELSRYLAGAPRHDVYHAEDCLTASGLLEFRAQAPFVELVRTVHHVERFSDPYLAGCQERSVRKAALRLVVSRAAEADVRRTFGVGAVRVSNGVSVARFAQRDGARIAALRARLGVGDEPVVLAVGGVEPRKNTIRTLLAFARLRADVPRARLVIIGGATVLDHGAYRAEYEAALSALPFATRSRVHELGVVPDAEVPAFFHLARVLSFPSVEEGFGLVALEALAAGLPVVASAMPPLTEFLDDSVATLIDPGSEEQIARGLFLSLSAPPARVAAGRRRAAAYSWERVAAMHMDAYRSLTGVSKARFSSFESIPA
jgi:glycosyltransferase-like protein